VETREIHENDNATESRTDLQAHAVGQESQDASRDLMGDGIVGIATPMKYEQQHSRGKLGTKSASASTITRKEVPARTSATPSKSRTYSSPPLTHQTQAQPETSRPNSRFSGATRGPVPDIYAYAGVSIENEEELERLEEEERRIDEAIRESESRAQIREEMDEREEVRKKIRGLRDSL